MNKSVLTLLALLTVGLLTAVVTKTMMMPRGADVVSVTPGGNSDELYDIYVLADEPSQQLLAKPEVRTALAAEGVRTVPGLLASPNLDVTLSVADGVISAQSQSHAGAVFIEVLQQNLESGASARAMGLRFSNTRAPNPATPSGK